MTDWLKRKVRAWLGVGDDKALTAGCRVDVDEASRLLLDLAAQMHAVVKQTSRTLEGVESHEMQLSAYEQEVPAIARVYREGVARHARLQAVVAQSAQDGGHMANGVIVLRPGDIKA